MKFYTGYRRFGDKDKDKLPEESVEINTDDLMRGVSQIAREASIKVAQLCTNHLAHSPMGNNGKLSMESMDALKMTIYHYNLTYTQVFLDESGRMIKALSDREMMIRLGIDPNVIEGFAYEAAKKIVDEKMRPVNEAIARIERITKKRDEMEENKRKEEAEKKKDG